MYKFRWDVFWSSWPVLSHGLWLTIQITAIVMVISMVVAIPLAAMRMSTVQLLRWPAQAYIELFRCTPLLIQLIWIYYALPALTGITLTARVSAIIALSANISAYMAEAYRAGFQAVPREHIEAGRVLGLTGFDVLRSVTLPQMIRQQIPVILSLDIILLKDTSLVSTIGLADLTYDGNLLASQNFRPLEVYTALAVMYFLIAFPATLAVNALERHVLRASDNTIVRSRSTKAATQLAGVLTRARG
jgi:polar amino acid transport system permease protein